MISGLGLLADQNKRLREALELYAYEKGAWKEISHIDYCRYCNWSKDWIAQHGHSTSCLLWTPHNG